MEEGISLQVYLIILSIGHLELETLTSIENYLNKPLDEYNNSIQPLYN